MGGARGESGRRVEPSIAGVAESSATSPATHYSDGRRAAGPPCWRSRATLHASGARVDLPSGQPSLEPRRADELTRRTASCVCRAACPGHQRTWHAVARQGPRADFSCPATMLVSSTSSLSSGSVQPPTSGVPPQTDARAWQAEGERGWKHARLGQALLPRGRNRGGLLQPRAGAGASKGAGTWFVDILVQLHPRVLRLLAAVLLVGAVRGDEAEDQHRVDQQVQKPMHARPTALHAAGTARAPQLRQEAPCWRC